MTCSPLLQKNMPLSLLIDWLVYSFIHVCSATDKILYKVMNKTEMVFPLRLTSCSLHCLPMIISAFVLFFILYFPPFPCICTNSANPTYSWRYRSILMFLMNTFVLILCQKIQFLIPCYFIYVKCFPFSMSLSQGPFILSPPVDKAVYLN